MGVPHWTGDRPFVVEVQVPENPKRLGSKCQERFDRYRTGMTVEEHIEACKTAPRPNDALSDITWDLERRYIVVVKPLK
jgi:hypothetical protein